MRHCVRSFTEQKISREQIEKALDYARYAASSKNMQPWHLAICQGAMLSGLSMDLINAAKSGMAPVAELGESRDKRIPDIYMDRARKCGYSLFQHKGIARDDKEARLEHWCENYRFFGASTVIIFYYDLELPNHCLIDIGIFLERLMEGFSQQKISTCPQASLAAFPQILDEHIKMPKHLSPLFGLSVGYEDKFNSVNQFRTAKLDFNEFVFWQN